MAGMFLKMKTMKAVYEYYIEDSSLAEYFGKTATQVLTTVLTMDFKYAWNHPKIKYSLWEQVDKVKMMAKEVPVLPFLFCDPRRINSSQKVDNLYELFNHAFTGQVPFFGVKIYPALGYLPSDLSLIHI